MTVTLEITAGHHLLPALKSCTVSIPQGADTGAVLDAGVASGCLDSWQASSFGGFGRFVECIDDVCSETTPVEGTFWAFYVNEVAAPVGIDSYFPGEGDVIDFTYTDWYTGIVLP